MTTNLNIALLPSLVRCWLVLLQFLMEGGKKRKRNKSPWVPKADGRYRKKKAKGNFCEKKKGSLAESDKGSWYSPPLNNREEENTAAISTPSTSRRKIMSSDIREESKPKVVDKGLDSKDADSTSTSSSSDESDDARSDSEQRCVIFDTRNLQAGLDESTSCRKCGSDIKLKQKSRAGIAGEWILQCQNEKCPLFKNPASFHSTAKSGRCYDANRALVLAFRLIGRGHSAADKFASVLNLHKPVNKTPWSFHTKALTEAAEKVLAMELNRAVLEVKRFKLQNGDFDGIDGTCDDEQLKAFVMDVGVSLDGSWSSRGWSARDGLVAAVSIDTGKVLDVVFLTNSCSVCTKQENRRNLGEISRMEFLSWYLRHESNCYLNHDGSSQVSYLLLCPL